ncbi:MAG: hypothetical protein D4S02_15105 [Rhodocyclaceae bacterium]|nr:MAG: hypothetical protein D4S02_15105 [Rhodocyclaceae bacterium]
MMDTQGHCHRPWWKRPPVWFIAIAAAVLLAILAIEQTDKPTLTPYSAFLDQLDAGNVASVTFQGTEIDGRYKHPLDNAQPGGAKAPRDTFSSRIPDFGDPALLTELRKQHIPIYVSSPSQWSSLLAHVPWPMLLFLGVAILAGFLRLMRGGKSPSGSVGTPLPEHGMMGIVSRLLGKQESIASPPKSDVAEPKDR